MCTYYQYQARYIEQRICIWMNVIKVIEKWVHTKVHSFLEHRFCHSSIELDIKKYISRVYLAIILKAFYMSVPFNLLYQILDNQKWVMSTMYTLCTYVLKAHNTVCYKFCSYKNLSKWKVRFPRKKIGIKINTLFQPAQSETPSTKKWCYALSFKVQKNSKKV